MNNKILIKNITTNDESSKKIRIVVANKHLFPIEEKGVPKTYRLNFIYLDNEFKAKYTIGSKDGKSRSGVLILGSDVYDNLIKIKAKDILKIVKENNKYTISKEKNTFGNNA